MSYYWLITGFIIAFTYYIQLVHFEVRTVILKLV